MFMEAVLESLKDMEVKKPSAEEEPSQKVVEKEGSLAATKPATMEATNHHDSAAPQDLLPHPSKSPAETPAPNCDVSSHKDSGKDVSGSNQSSTTINDTVDHTKATVTVEKTPTSNVMDGLLRRWDINFFRNR